MIKTANPQDGLWHHIEDSLMQRRITYSPEMEREKFKVKLYKEKAAL